MSSNLLTVGRERQVEVVQALMSQVRPHWKAKRLIERVTTLLPVDPGSACQKLLNATFHDLKEKVELAGLDIAKQAAEQRKLPPVNRPEDLENYSADKLLDLSHEMGLLSRPEWRRLKRCYEIRRDLEHEDDEYEAGVEDCVYIFSTSIGVVLSKDPVQLLKVVDLKEFVERPEAFATRQELGDDYEKAPDPRQLEIVKYLVATVLKEDNADLVRKNAFHILQFFEPRTRNSVKLEVAKHIQDRVGRHGLTRLLVRVAQGAGVFAYLKESKRQDFYKSYLDKFIEIGTGWRQYDRHRDPLSELESVGGLVHCPDGEVFVGLVRWMTICYFGVRGGRTMYGNVRPVYYSNVAVAFIERMVAAAKDRVLPVLQSLRQDAEVSRRLSECNDLVGRFDELVKLAT